MDNDGVLTIGIKDLDNDRISCFIRDSGYGMEKTIREQIFSPFFTTKSADTGTGLGLYIVKNICKNHNVEIKCESEAGKGTVFNLLFPLTENANV
jgi:signal transduction histidine kinase